MTCREAVEHSTNAARFVDELLIKHRDMPGFPFDDWATDAASFHGVRALWQELFKAAAGDRHADYENVIEPRMDADFSPYDVALRDRQRRVAIHPERRGGGFTLAMKFATDDYRPNIVRLGELPDRSWFAIASDVDPERLKAVFDMIRIYVSTPFKTLEAEERMNQEFIKAYGHLFSDPET